MDMRWHRDLGPDVWIRQTRSVARGPSGAPKYFVAVVEDISLRKQAEEQRSLGTEELARSNAELEQFAYVVSHDLQEPLRMVASYVQLIEARYKDRLDSDAHDFIAFAVDGATRMKQMIGDLLAYSRVGRKGREFVPVACEGAWPGLRRLAGGDEPPRKSATARFPPCWGMPTSSLTCFRI
jgi:signal transduction histidine kinase